MAFHRRLPRIGVGWVRIAGLIFAGLLAACATPVPPVSVSDGGEAFRHLAQPSDSRSLRRRDEAIRALFAAHIQRNPGFLLQTALPSLHRGISDILRLGHAEEVSRNDFYHAHLVYPRDELVAYPTAAELRSNIRILYHSRERPHRIREDWIDEIASLDDPFVQAWIQEVRRTDFDYQDFFYGSRRFVRRQPLPAESVSRLAESWHSESRTSEDVRELKERIRYIQGSTQPGYAAAAEALFLPRSFLAPLGSTTLRRVPVHPPDYLSIATVYFRRSSGTGPLEPDSCHNGSGRTPESSGAGLAWPKRDIPAERWYWGYCYSLVVYRKL